MMLASMWDTVIGGVIAAGAGVIAVVVSAVLAEGARKRAEHAARIEKAASGVGRTLSLLREAQPEGIVGAGPEKAREIILDVLWPRWEPLQDELEMVAAGDRNEAIRDAADALIEAMRKLFQMLRFYADLRGEEPLRTEQWDDVKKRHADAVASAKAFVRTLHA